MGDTGPGARQETEPDTEENPISAGAPNDHPTGGEAGGTEGQPLDDQSDQPPNPAPTDEAGDASEERPPAGSRRTRIVVAVLLLVIAATGGVLLGTYATSPDRRPHPVTTLAPSPPTTAPTSTATVPASPTTP